jgi:hypothetical protein
MSVFVEVPTELPSAASLSQMYIDRVIIHVQYPAVFEIIIGAHQ